MKKIFSVFLALTMLVGMMAMFATTASATVADEPLSAKAYSPADDNQYVYVVFNKPVTLGNNVWISPAWWQQWGSVPAESSKLAASKDGAMPNAFSGSDEVVKISDQVYKFTNTTWKNAGTANVLFNPNADGYYGNATKKPVDLVLFGDVIAVDGTPLTLTDPNNPNPNNEFAGRFHWDLSGTNFHAGYVLSYATADSKDNLPVPTYTAPAAGEPLKAVAAYRISGNNNDLYVVFNKKVAAPAAGNDLQFFLAAYGWDGAPGDWDKANTAIARVHFLFAEAVSDQVFKFTRDGHVEWACEGWKAPGASNISSENQVVTPQNGYWFWGVGGNTKITTADGVETLEQDLAAVWNAYGCPSDNPWAASVPCATIAKTEFGSLPIVTSTSDIVVPTALAPIAPPAETQAPAVSDDVVVPPQGDVASVIALVAIVGLAGVVVAKKRK